jgi:MFS family permease
MRGALADPRFRRLLVGLSLSTFGDTALYLTLGIWAKALTHSNSAAGGVFLALGIPAFLAPLAGHLADRVRRRPLLICANALSAGVVLLLLAVHSPGQLWIIYLVAFWYGNLSNVLGGALAGLRKDMLADENLASANALLSSVGQGMRIVAPLAGAGLYVAFGGGAVAVLDAVTFGAAIAALMTIKVAESPPQTLADGSRWQDMIAGFRHIRAVPLLTQVTLVTACAFSVIGLSETIIFAVIAQGLHRPPSFFGIVSSAQGGGAICGGVALAWLMRRVGTARMAGLGLGAFAFAAVAYTADSVVLVLAAAALDGVGVVWLVATITTAMQRFSPPRLQGRVNAAWTMLIITPQTISIAAGTVLIAFVNYRLLLAAVACATGAGALFLLVRPAPEPAAAALDPGDAGTGDAGTGDAGTGAPVLREA